MAHKEYVILTITICNFNKYIAHSYTFAHFFWFLDSAWTPFLERKNGWDIHILQPQDFLRPLIHEISWPSGMYNPIPSWQWRFNCNCTLINIYFEKIFLKFLLKWEESLKETFQQKGGYLVLLLPHIYPTELLQSKETFESKRGRKERQYGWNLEL